MWETVTDSAIMYFRVDLNSLLAVKDVLIQYQQGRLKEDFKQALTPCPLLSQLCQRTQCHSVRMRFMNTLKFKVMRWTECMTSTQVCIPDDYWAYTHLSMINQPLILGCVG